MKTGLCNFSGFKIYPGHGMKVVRADSRSFTFLNGKCEALFLNKKNPRKVRWTQVYRRMHKKGISQEESQKKKSRKIAKPQRAIVGASLEVIKQKRNQKPEVRSAQREAALREVKERNKKAAEAKGKTVSATKATTAKPAASKTKATGGKGSAGRK
eukprot:TRINITY_DN446_c0_g1_i1.p1 TRINITY_DN446_c0_g1~~TRINITY_DN446_c0_g1_i1.p1  ORF type:complete len:177 (+),score=52.15 TRINITY_DN446_c0_g1_i1:64-531(+)